VPELASCGTSPWTRVLEDEGDDDNPMVTVGEAARLWRGGTALEALTIWSEALSFLMTESLEIDAGLDEELAAGLDFYGAGVGLVTRCSWPGRGCPCRPRRRGDREGATGELPAAEAAQPGPPDAGPRRPRRPLLRRLAELGAVRLDDEGEGRWPG